MNLEESNSYKFNYSRFRRSKNKNRIHLILLVGAGRFERPTPCAQGSFQQRRKPHIFRTFCFKRMWRAG